MEPLSSVVFSVRPPAASRTRQEEQHRTPLWKGLTAAALAACLCATGVLAAGHHGQGLRQAAVCDTGVSCADANGDGVCGYHGTTCGVCFADADGDGICDNCGTRCGVNFADADGDGICDNYGTGLGSQHHGGHRGGCRNH